MEKPPCLTGSTGFVIGLFGLLNVHWVKAGS